MVGCCACGAPIGWWAASLTSPISPFTCAACGEQQHRAGWWRNVFWLLVLTTVFVFGALIALSLWGPVAGLSVWSGLIVAIALVEWRVWRNAPMVPIDTEGKRKAGRQVLALSVAGLVFALLAEAGSRLLSH
jgi:hypothetical protein